MTLVTSLQALVVEFEALRTQVSSDHQAEMVYWESSLHNLKRLVEEQQWYEDNA